MSSRKLQSKTRNQDNQQNAAAIISDLLVIDWEKGKKIMNGNSEEAKQILLQFIAYLPSALKLIRKAVKNNEEAKLLEEVHKLHGACSYCGVPRLKAVAKTLETALRNQDQSQINLLTVLLVQEAELLLKTAEQDNFLNAK